jgi:two-component system NtrC family sensor kinase
MPSDETGMSALTELQQEVARLRDELVDQRLEKERLSKELGLRDAALDAASSHFMIVGTAESLPVVYVNRACANAYGYEPAEVMGQSARMLAFLEPHSKEALSRMAEQMALGEPVRIEGEAVRRDGSIFWLGVVTTQLRGPDGNMTHIVSVGADITARREAELKRKELQEQLLGEMRERERMAIELRLAQKLESVGRLAAGLAHEINTPIQYVGDSVHFLRSAFSDLAGLLDAYRTALTDSCDPAGERKLAELRAIEADIDYEFLRIEAPRAFERTLEGTERVAGIVRAMKEFAHPDGCEQSPADLNHAIETTLVVARNEYKYLAEVVSHFAPLPAVTCNIGELNQVILNLIINAAHAIHDSGKDVSVGRITVETRVVEDCVEVIIGDNGCGIPEENLEKIFDPFYTTKEVGRGTGQGLAIARAIVVDKHGGDIKVNSIIGSGTQFTLRLPIAGQASDGPMLTQAVA